MTNQSEKSQTRMLQVPQGTWFIFSSAEAADAMRTLAPEETRPGAVPNIVITTRPITARFDGGTT